jgi:membrane-bound ClpP family serine protease
MSLCAYSNILGVPGAGVHSIRIFNVAIVDVIFTILGAYAIYYYVNKTYMLNLRYWVYLVGLFVMGIILHKVFCVKTTINNLIFRE